MAARDFSARKIVRAGMETLRWRCEPRDWQRQLDYARQRTEHRGLRISKIALGVGLPWALVGGYLISLAPGPLTITGFVLPIAGAVVVSARKRWYPDRGSSTAPPEVLFTSTGVLIDNDIARPWRGAGYRLVDAHVSNDVHPWVELGFQSRWRIEIYELPVPEGRLKAAMEITEMLRARGTPVADTSTPGPR